MNISRIKNNYTKNFQLYCLLHYINVHWIERNLSQQFWKWYCHHIPWSDVGTGQWITEIRLASSPLPAAGCTRLRSSEVDQLPLLELLTCCHLQHHYPHRLQAAASIIQGIAVCHTHTHRAMLLPLHSKRDTAAGRWQERTGHYTRPPLKPQPMAPVASPVTIPLSTMEEDRGKKGDEKNKSQQA